MTAIAELLAGDPNQSNRIRAADITLHQACWKADLHRDPKRYLDECYESLDRHVLEVSIVETTAVRLRNDIVGYLEALKAVIEASRLTDYQNTSFQQFMRGFLGQVAHMPAENTEACQHLVMHMRQGLEQIVEMCTTVKIPEYEKLLDEVRAITLFDASSTETQLMSDLASARTALGVYAAEQRLIDFADSLVGSLKEDS